MQKHTNKLINIILIIIITQSVLILTLSNTHTIHKTIIIRDTVIVKDTIQTDYILHDKSNKQIVDKYLDKMPHKDIQLKYMVKYNIPFEAGIIINFIESNFESDIQAVNKCFNAGGGVDYGSMQINDKYHTQIKEYVRSNDIESYYNYAYKHLSYLKRYSIQKNGANYFQLMIKCWNSKTPSVQNNYEYGFLRRANKELKELYGV